MANDSLRKDFIAVALFLLLAALVQFLRISETYSTLSLTSDATNYASVAAARDHPGMFRGDELLDDPANYRYIAVALVEFISLFQRLTGHYASWFAYTIGLHVFLQMLGFFLLGRVLFRDRYWSAVLALLSLASVRTPIDFWSFYPDPIPRVMFHSALPFVLAAAFAWRDKPRLWPLVMAVAGLLIYIHPVSAPPVGFAVWLGLWCIRPSGWNPPKRFAWMIACGLIFLAVTAPFLINYLTHHEHGATNDYRLIMHIYTYRFPGIYMNIPRVFLEFLRLLMLQLVLPLGLLGFAVAWLRGADRRAVVAIPLLWIVGLLLVCVAAPALEQYLRRETHTLPVQVDLIRGTKYLAPLLMTGFFWGVTSLTNALSGSKRIAAGAAITLCLLVWTFAHRPDATDPVVGSVMRRVGIPRAWIQSAEKGRGPGPSNISLGRLPVPKKDALDALNALRRLTPPGATVLPCDTVFPLAVRYVSLRPVVFSQKDGGTLAYSNHAQLIKWYSLSQRMLEVERRKNLNGRFTGYVAEGRKLGAQYLLLDFKPQPATLKDSSVSIIYENPTVFIMKIAEQPSDTAVQ